MPPEEAEHFETGGHWPTSWMSRVKLERGKTVAYPRIVVYPIVDLNIEDLAEIEASEAASFVLTWPPVPGYSANEITYEVDVGAVRKRAETQFARPIPSFWWSQSIRRFARPV